MSNFNRKMKYASLSIISNTILITLKIIAGIISGSVTIISEAIHSGMDLIASIIAFFSVKYSSKPADLEHPYGHGKIESISGFLEALLIFVAALLIIKEAIDKIINPITINITATVIAVMVFAAITNTFISKILYKVAKEEDSIALEADALHLKTDVYTSLGVAFGLLLIKYTGLYILDPIVAILVALLILKEAWELSKKTLSILLDAKLSDKEEKNILEIIHNYQNQYYNIHHLRTRKAGNIKYIDFHMTVDGTKTVEEAHELCDLIEKDLEYKIKNTSVNIHIEPGNG